MDVPISPALSLTSSLWILLMPKTFAPHSKSQRLGIIKPIKVQDFFAGFTRHKWEQLLTTAGLEIISLERGNWAQKPGARTFQDLLIVTPRRGIDDM